MPHVEVSVRIKKDAESLWREIGSFQGVGAWHPLLRSVRGQGGEPGAIRIAETPDGHKQVERLQSIEPREHCYRYMMLSSPMPVKDYVGEFRVHQDGESNSTVSWSNDFSSDLRGREPGYRHDSRISQRGRAEPEEEIFLTA